MTDKGIDFESVDYVKKDFFTEAELKHLLDAAGLSPREAIRKNEPAYRQHVADRNLSDEQLIRAMTEHPELIQRPFVTLGTKTVLARPPEKLSELGIS